VDPNPSSNLLQTKKVLAINEALESNDYDLLLSDHEYVTWAVEMLVAGHDSRLLRQLAASTDKDSHFEILTLVKGVIQELQLPKLRGNCAYASFAAGVIGLALQSNDLNYIICIIYQLGFLARGTPSEPLFEDFAQLCHSVRWLDEPTSQSIRLSSFDDAVEKFRAMAKEWLRRNRRECECSPVREMPI
jgi:hypothetical protein